MSDMNSLLTTALQDEMSCGILTNTSGDILILHDKEIRSDLQWVEFDKSQNKLFLIHEDGTPQELGIKLNEQTASNLSHGQTIGLTQVHNKQVGAVQNFTIIIQDY